LVAIDARNMIKISYNQSFSMHAVRDFTNLHPYGSFMTELLTTKQVQTILHVDRTTIYRMVEGGQLPAVRVGKQWRFAADDVDRWLKQGRYPAPAAELAADEAATSSAAFTSAADDSLATLLPQGCAQAVQDAFADLLGVTMIITDMQGRPITQMSNPCGLFSALMERNPEGLEHCVHTWQQMASFVALEPKFALSEMGLLCARGLIRVGAELKGMVVIGGIAPDSWPPSAEQAEDLATLFGVASSTVAANADAVFRLDRATQERALRFVQRIADVFAQLVRDGHPAQA
jgi:excisionase family DNA binding protein